MTIRKFGKTVQQIILGLPLAGIIVANLLPVSRGAHQFLVAVVLIWFQVFICSEVFSPGTDL